MSRCMSFPMPATCRIWKRRATSIGSLRPLPDRPAIGGSDERSIQAALARSPFLSKRLAGRSAVEPLPSFTNRTYKVRVGEEDYVLRLAGAGTGRFIDRDRERGNAVQAAGLGLAPDIVHFDAEDGTMLTSFIAGGVPLDAARLRDPEMLRRAVLLLKRLHGSPCQFAGRRDLSTTLDEYFDLADQSPQQGAGGLLDLRRQTDKLRARLPQWAMSTVPSHIDPAPSNFVATPSAIFLVDWEYSAMAEPIWDLADLSAEVDFDDRHDRLLLETYFGATPGEIAERFRIMKVLFHALAVVWARLQVVDGVGGNDLARFGEARMQRFDVLYRESMR